MPASSASESSKDDHETRSASTPQLPNARNIFILSDGQPREFLWACQLSKESPEVTWTFDEEDGDLDYIHHTLFLRNAILGVNAKKDERNIIQAETKNYLQKEVKVLLASLTLGKSDMCALDLNFSHEIPVTFRLVEGTGPVHLSGQHLAELPPTHHDDEDEEEEEDEDSEEDEDEDDDDRDVVTDIEEESESEGAETEVVEVKAKKRKSAAKTPAEKRSKMSSKSSDDDDEDDVESMEDDEEEEAEAKKKSKGKAIPAKKQTNPKALKTKVKTNAGKAKSKARSK